MTDTTHNNTMMMTIYLNPQSFRC